MARAKRSRSERPESPEIGKAAERFMRSLVRRAGEGDWEALEELNRLVGVAQGALNTATRDAHAFGHSYADLGKVLGISRQSVMERAHRAL
jgi:DNA-directed RNA polymerase specialized sigma24 family protein